jgi:hypothetical protein
VIWDMDVAATTLWITSHVSHKATDHDGSMHQVQARKHGEKAINVSWL